MPQDKKTPAAKKPKAEKPTPAAKPSPTPKAAVPAAPPEKPLRRMGKPSNPFLVQNPPSKKFPTR